MKHDARVSNSQETYKLTEALKMLQTTDFEKMMGSGIMISLTPITENKHLCDEFMIPTEDMKDIAPLIAASLKRHLILRKARLQCEIGDITKVTA